jgi:excisionase family DNA binding protein
MQIGDEQVLSLQEAASRLGVSPITLSKQAKKGVLRATMIGRSYAVTASEVERYRAEHLGRRGGFEDPNHPMHGEQGPGRGRPKKTTESTLGSVKTSDDIAD